ncbi:hypothetical protein [Streptomyces sp. NPDC057579]|uniref:hypothetical protein n=1 Tax=unclassified Streptomyces TaxID=2593676 RepID=UPI00369D3222
MTTPHLAVCAAARGRTRHLPTRVYPPTPDRAPTTDPRPAALPPERRAPRLAAAEPQGSHRFDIRLQGPAETVFLEFA